MKSFAIAVHGAPQGATETRAPAVSVARDVARIVAMAVLAGTAFALLLALSILSLTVIAPPAQASGGPVVVSEAPPAGPGPTLKADKPVKQEAPIQLAAATPEPAAKAAAPVSVATHEAVYESLDRPSVPAALYVVLVLVAAFLAYFIYTVAKRKP